MYEKKEQLFEWCNSSLIELDQAIALSISPLREEASFRKYFRLNRKKDSIIGVYSPPELESNKEFISLSNFLSGKYASSFFSYVLTLLTLFTCLGHNDTAFWHNDTFSSNLQDYT